MNDTTEMQDLRWQIMQRNLAAGRPAESAVYPLVRRPAQPHWRFTPATGSWLSRTRNGVEKPRATVA